MLQTMRRSPAQQGALEQIEKWTRTRFSLPPAAAVVVTELACTVPGCPPVETVVGFWTEDERRHHFKVFKPAADVAEADLPPYWLKDALRATAVLGCECC
jgi:hypothetical protein